MNIFKLACIAALVLVGVIVCLVVWWLQKNGLMMGIVADAALLFVVAAGLFFLVITWPRS